MVILTKARIATDDTDFHELLPYEMSYIEHQNDVIPAKI